MFNRTTVYSPRPRYNRYARRVRAPKAKPAAIATLRDFFVAVAATVRLDGAFRTKGEAERIGGESTAARAVALIGTTYERDLDDEILADRAIERAAELVLAGTRTDFDVSLKNALLDARELGGVSAGYSASVCAIVVKNILDADRRESERVDFDAAPIAALFELAKASGKKAPVVRIESPAVTLRLAGPRSRNRGAINVTDGKPFGENKWYGLIADGRFEPSRSCTPDVTAALVELAATAAKGVAA